MTTVARTEARTERIALLRPAEREQWDRFVAAHPQGTIYHRLAWQAVTEEGFGHRPYYLRAAEATGELTGVLPLFLVRGVFGRRLVSVPLRDRGGVLAIDPATASALIAQAVQLGRELGCQYVELRGQEPLDPPVVSANALRCESHWVGTRVDLSVGSQQLWKQADKGSARWAVNTARKRGARVERDDTERGMEIFYELLVHTRRTMGVPPFRQALFLAIWRHLICRGLATLWLAWVDSTPIGGMIGLHSGDTYIMAYAAPQKAWRQSYPSESVVWRGIEWAADNGFRYFDFGADSPRQTGLLAFKKKWGGVQHPTYYYFHFAKPTDAAPIFDGDSPAYALARRAWAVLPAPVCQALGGWVTTQLS